MKITRRSFGAILVGMPLFGTIRSFSFRRGRDMASQFSGITRSSHHHLDGSLALLNILPELHRLSGKNYSFNRWAGHHRQVINWFGDVHRDIVEKFSITTGVMQNPVTIFSAAEEYVIFYGRKGFESLKPTIAPQYHVLGDKFTPPGLLNEKDVIGIVIAGLKSGAEKIKKELNREIKVKPLFGIGREVSSPESERLVRIASDFDPADLAGISLVCDEPENPPEKHLDAFQLAKRLGIKERRCHVEWVKNRKHHEKNTPEKIMQNYQDDKPQLRKNLQTAIFDLEVTHIDHAFSLPDNDDLVDEVIKRGIGITVCPGSLLFTGLITDPRILRLREMLRRGVRLSIDSDDDLFMMDMDEAIRFCSGSDPFTSEEIGELNKNAEL